MGQPDGGWYDETPPHVVGATPEDQSTNVRARNITIYFDEYIKLDNPTEKVVVSPPQLEAPEIKGAGRRITVELKDSLLPGTTYTVDFSDAISDNNEGNPLGNYTYSFSTGEHIDTMEVAGHVVEAENMEPIKGILVGLYDNLSDTAFSTQSMLRVARTDSRGYFVIKGVAPGNYRIYALQEADGDYRRSQKSEKIAFTHDIITPTCKPDVRQDTLWRDSLHIADIIPTGYTHFLPDDIVLRAFTEEQTDRFFLKNERKQADNFTLFFTYGHSELPEMKGLNFDERDAFLLEANEQLDTLRYWIKDTLLVNQDTLQMQLRFLATDSTGTLQMQTDTISVLSKEPYAKRMKERQKEQEKWEKQQEKARKKGKEAQDEMPPVPLDIKVGIKSDMMPDNSITIEAATPILAIDTTKIHLSVKRDTLFDNKPFILRSEKVDVEGMESAQRKFILLPDSTGNLWTIGAQYSLVIDSAAFTDIYGNVSTNIKKGATIRKEEDFTTIIFHVAQLEDAPYVGQLLDSQDKVVRHTSSPTGDLTFNYVKPGEYYLRVFADNNNNGRWDTGNYDEDRQAEKVYYYPEKVECKAHWPLEKSWNPGTEKILKPSAITKQKPDKEKRIKSQNMARAQKLGIIYIPPGTNINNIQKK
ncbi:MAG: Ig-like domain-containing protein [Prevotella sp.]|nr:Ig-like domain-containing protein [Prevotella sp.]